MAKHSMDIIKGKCAAERDRIGIALKRQFWPPSRTDFRGWWPFLWVTLWYLTKRAAWGWLLIAILFGLSLAFFAK